MIISSCTIKPEGGPPLGRFTLHCRKVRAHRRSPHGGEHSVRRGRGGDLLTARASLSDSGPLRARDTPPLPFGPTARQPHRGAPQGDHHPPPATNRRKEHLTSGLPQRDHCCAPDFVGSGRSRNPGGAPQAAVAANRLRSSATPGLVCKGCRAVFRARSWPYESGECSAVTASMAW